jgi:tRNA (Uracil-5-)-methyltransferase
MQANFHTTLSGESMVTLVYHKALNEDWVEAAQKLRFVLGACPSSRVPLTTIVGRSFKQKLELDTDYVTESLQVGTALVPDFQHPVHPAFVPCPFGSSLTT